MLPPNEFWYVLHALAKSYDNEGASPARRTVNIVSQFCKMPPMAQRECLVALDQVLDDLHKLRPIVAEVVQHSDNWNLRLARIRSSG